MKYPLLLACPLLLTAAQPAPRPPAATATPPAPAAGTAGRDAQCAIVLSTALWIVERNTTSPAPPNVIQSMREATTFYVGRLGARYATGRIGPAVVAARATLPPRGPAWQAIATACGNEFTTLARAITAEVTPTLNR